MLPARASSCLRGPSDASERKRFAWSCDGSEPELFAGKVEMSVEQKDRVSFADQISYDDLYGRWEEGNWKATEIDFSEDRSGWASLSEIQRRSALWTYSMFFFGEDSVTENLSPYIDAAPKEEQKYFLATQQVDEARHSLFFHRFFKEVIGAGRSVGST